MKLTNSFAGRGRRGVVVCGYYGSGSLGDEAVLGVICDALKGALPPERITVISASPLESARRYLVRATGRLNIAGIIAALMKSRLLVLGGGSLLQDTTSRRSLLYYTFIVRLAHLCRCRVYIYSNGTGPLRRPGAASDALFHADRVTLRDPDSLRTAICLGADPVRTALSADPAFALAPARRWRAESFLMSVGIRPGQRFAAISLRECGGKAVNLFAVAAVCRRLKADGITPLLMPLQDSYDMELCRSVAASCGGIIGRTDSFQLLAAVLEKSEFAIGMRLHFLLAAAIAGTPFVALSYDCKVDSAVKYIGCGELLPAFELDYSDLLAAVRRAAADKERTAQMLKERLPSLRALAMSDAAELIAAAR